MRDEDFIGTVTVPDPYDVRPDGIHMDIMTYDRLKRAIDAGHCIRFEQPSGTIRWHVLDPKGQKIQAPVGTRMFVELDPPPERVTVWVCKIGVRTGSVRLAGGVDQPMRRAIKEAFESVIGMDAEFCFSGWGGDLTETERLIVEDRVSEMSDHFLFQGQAGALMSSHEIPGVTQDLDDTDASRFYGGRWFVGETVSVTAMRRIASALGLRFKEG